MNKFLLFTTGGGTSDPLNWDSSEAALYNVDSLESVKPSSARNVDLIFNTSNGKEAIWFHSIDNVNQNPYYLHAHLPITRFALAFESDP